MKRVLQRFNPHTIPLVATAFVLLALYLGGCLHFRNFASLEVFTNLLGDNAFLGVAALGATFVILCGGIDLSVGSVLAFTSIFVASLIEKHHLPPLVAIALALCLGSIFGAAQGTLIHFYRLPPFLVTLAGMFFARGLAFMVAPQSLPIKHAFYLETLDKLALHLSPKSSLPVGATCALFLFVFSHYLANFTRFGRRVYALGGDEESARMMGLPIARTKIAVYSLSGFCSALAGVLYSFYTTSGDPTAGVGFELDAIASVVIGGTLLSGGAGSIVGTGMGVLILGLIQTLITFQGTLDSWWTRIVIGVLVLAFLLLQKVLSSASRLQQDAA